MYDVKLPGCSKRDDRIVSKNSMISVEQPTVPQKQERKQTQAIVVGSIQSILLLLLSILSFNSSNSRSNSVTMVQALPPPQQQQTVSECTKTGSATSLKLSSTFPSYLPDLYSISLKLVSIVKEQVTVPEKSPTTFRQVAVEEIKRNNNAFASIVFVVRRPGCVLCREHGQQLVELVQKEQTNNQRTIALWGAIKEVGVDDTGLAEFYNTYFPYPLYHDVDLSFYKAFGNRKLTLSTWNPFRLYRGYKELNQRLNNKNLSGNLKGEGFKLGGILVLDNAGDVKYAFEEDIGKELYLGDIQSALEELYMISTSSLPVEQQTTVSSEL